MGTDWGIKSISCGDAFEEGVYGIQPNAKVFWLLQWVDSEAMAKETGRERGSRVEGKSMSLIWAWRVREGSL